MDKNTMEKINIETLFHCKTNRYQDMDIKSIVATKKGFNISSLIETRERKRKSLLENFNKLYQLCLRKVEIMNKLGKMDLLFTVPLKIPNQCDYDSIECLKFIKDKLDNDFFDTYIVNSDTLFITWLYLEVNRIETLQKQIQD